MYFKKSLAKHRLSLLMSVLWAVFGYLVFAVLITPIVFNPVVRLWQESKESITPLYIGLGCSLLSVTLFMISARRFPYSNRYELLVSLSVTTNALVFLLLAGTRSFYSGSVICAFTVFQIIWLSLEMLYRIRYVEYHFAVFPTRIKLTPEDFPEYKVTFSYSEREMAEHYIDAIIVEDENALDTKWAARLEYCQSIRMPVISLSVFLENAWGRIPLEIQNASPDISNVYSSWYLILKRILDRALAVVGIVILLPVMILLALLVLVTSGRPVLFNQKRCGLDNRIFVLYKLRTMYENKDGKRKITRLGAILRKYHLDELPQLFNVLNGDLSLVGPRPETPELTEYYKKNIPYYGLRTKINQGVVGWALIHQGNVAGVEDTAVKLSYDIYYIKHASLFLDAYIVLKSIWLVLFGIEKVKAPNCLGVFKKEAVKKIR